MKWKRRKRRRIELWSNWMSEEAGMPKLVIKNGYIVFEPIEEKGWRPASLAN